MLRAQRHAPACCSIEGNTTHDLADRLSKPQLYVSKYERGERLYVEQADPSVSAAIQKAADACERTGSIERL